MTKETLAKLFDAMHCVRERKYRAGAAPERVQEHIAFARKKLQADRHEVITRMQRLDASRHRLDSGFAALQRKFKL